MHVASGALDQAEDDVTAALTTFVAIEAAFEAARTRLDLAEIARMRGESRTALGHLEDARRAFGALGLPAFVAQVDRLTSALAGSAERA